MGWKKGIGKRRSGRVAQKRVDGRRFTIEETGQELVVESSFDFECPFCGANVVVTEEPKTIMHGLPMCKKFEDEDPLVFLRNARLIVVGPLPDDDEWPISPSSDGKRN